MVCGTKVGRGLWDAPTLLPPLTKSQCHLTQKRQVGTGVNYWLSNPSLNGLPWGICDRHCLLRELLGRMEEPSSVGRSPGPTGDVGTKQQCLP